MYYEILAVYLLSGWALHYHMLKAEKAAKDGFFKNLWRDAPFFFVLFFTYSFLFWPLIYRKPIINLFRK